MYNTNNNNQDLAAWLTSHGFKASKAEMAAIERTQKMAATGECHYEHSARKATGKFMVRPKG